MCHVEGEMVLVGGETKGKDAETEENRGNRDAVLSGNL